MNVAQEVHRESTHDVQEFRLRQAWNVHKFPPSPSVCKSFFENYISFLSYAYFPFSRGYLEAPEVWGMLWLHAR